LPNTPFSDNTDAEDVAIKNCQCAESCFMFLPPVLSGSDVFCCMQLIFRREHRKLLLYCDVSSSRSSVQLCDFAMLIASSRLLLLVNYNSQHLIQEGWLSPTERGSVSAISLTRVTPVCRLRVQAFGYVKRV